MSVWKVFIPHELLYKESGYVVGNVWKELCLICVSGVVPSARLPSDKKHWSDEQLSSKLIGSWNIPEIKLTLESKLVFNSVCRKDIWIFLEYSMSSLVAKIAGAHVVCVIFNPEELWMSYFIQGATSVQSGVDTHRFSSSHIDNMIAAISDAKGSSLVTHFMENATRVKRSQWLIDFFLWMPLKFFTFLSYIYNRSIQIKFVKGFVTPAFTHQFGLKCMQVKYVTEHQKSSSEQLRFLNMSTKQYFDSLLGVSLIVFLAFKIISTAAIAECVMTWAENVANLLKTLLHWMMGSPVGLKLNHHLNQFLGKFFMYHIYLWTRYLALIRPVLDSVLWYTSLVGVFGFSFQLCLLQDIFSIMTFHIYCFYVYAARLYSLQILALSSLWRLFRGKKWNVLRQRVDSASYDVDQLFLGTLLFTILLFLLPTTALYYVVFTSLRLLILLIQSMLSKLVATINSLPLYTLLLWVLRSRSVAGNIVFRVWPTDDTNTTLILTMQIVQLPLTKLLAFCCYNNIKETEKDYSWKMFTKNIISGQLVYPWIESTEKN